MMRRQLADIHAAGEAVAVLWASEAAIYGRFGYGVATHKLELELRTREARLRPDVARAGAPEFMPPRTRGRVSAGSTTRSARCAPAWSPARTPGGTCTCTTRRRSARAPARSARWCSTTTAATSLYAYKTHWGSGGALEGELRLWELIATTPAAAAALWGFVLEVDLVRRATWFLAPADEPLRQMLDNERAVASKSLGDGLWVRLVDVPRALRVRTYSAPFDVVLDVADRVLPVEPRPLPAELGRERGGVRADRGRAGPCAVGGRAGSRVPRRDDARRAGGRRPCPGAVASGA